MQKQQIWPVLLVLTISNKLRTDFSFSLEPIGKVCMRSQEIWCYPFLLLLGPYKRTYIAAPQCLLRGRHNPRDVIHLVDCGSSWIAAAAMHQPQCTSLNPQDVNYIPSRALGQLQCTICGCRSLPGWVEFSLPQYRNISTFIPSHFYPRFNVLCKRQCWNASTFSRKAWYQKHL